MIGYGGGANNAFFMDYCEYLSEYSSEYSSVCF